MSETNAVKPQYQRVADELRLKIMAGEYLPGQRLPAEPDLDGVSRSTWREAIRTLQAESLVVATRGVRGGVFVAEPTADDVSRYLRNSLTLLARGRLRPEQILEVRRMLEVPAAGLAAQRRREAHLEQLADALTDSREKRGPEQWAANYQFHAVLLDATDNPLTSAILDPLTTVLRSALDRGQADEAFWAVVCGDHDEILTAIRDGDPAAAERAMSHHLDHLAKTYGAISRLADD
ncbi:FadR/GntR family transcriptional regulator [Amycolatopsis sp. GM8]|uniref:FadR/GntR family transcriptional regulator n=1 Tax=Amycolatopsis sp. GM8 TaxID=2896530 RepID=UPI001F39C7D6|nr:FCD domain-containing protein [Amycolatopsis sp. GM8]